MTPPLVELKAVSKRFEAGRGRSAVAALADVSLSIESGATVALVGESGSGKTTLGRSILGLSPPTDGVVSVSGEDVYDRDRAVRQRARSDIQVVFQNPTSSLDPTMSVGQIVCEPIREPRRLRGAQMRVRAGELLELVGLDPAYVGRRPFELSGGQQQRVAIARAIATDPRLVVLDEPTSSIDFAARRQILRLLRELQIQRALTYLYITHDLVSAQYIAPRTAVMYAGRVIETGPTSEVLRNPRHPYTRVLIESALSARPGVRPSVARPELVRTDQHNWDGCAFRQRCPLANQVCGELLPELRELAHLHKARCHYAERVQATEALEVG
jgi:oligopeptide/dipeptide ABC transporter ATP-binding protein